MDFVVWLAMSACAVAAVIGIARATRRGVRWWYRRRMNRPDPGLATVATRFGHRHRPEWKTYDQQKARDGYEKAVTHTATGRKMWRPSDTPSSTPDTNVTQFRRPG